MPDYLLDVTEQGFYMMSYDSTLHNLVASENPQAQGCSLRPYMGSWGVGGVGGILCFMLSFCYIFKNRNSSVRKDIAPGYHHLDSSERETNPVGKGVLQINLLWFGKSFSKWWTRSWVVILLGGLD